MQFLADENFPFPSVKFLLEKNIQIDFIKETQKGMSDGDVLALAFLNNQIILTFDKGDFGNLIFQNNFSNVHGIILFRMKNYLPDEPGKIFYNSFLKGFEFEKYFTVIKSLDEIKQKDLPNSFNILELL